jgi:hypothetical protein
MVYTSRQNMFVTDALKTFSTRKIHVWLQASVWRAAHLFASLQRIAYCHGLKRARSKCGTDLHINAFIS